MPNLPQPFNPETIKKYPVAVLAAFLIGVILLQWGFNRWDKEQQLREIHIVRHSADSVIKSELQLCRMKLAECERNSKQITDSLLRMKYGAMVQKTIQRYEK